MTVKNIIDRVLAIAGVSAFQSLLFEDADKFMFEQDIAYPLCAISKTYNVERVNRGNGYFSSAYTFNIMLLSQVAPNEELPDRVLNLFGIDFLDGITQLFIARLEQNIGSNDNSGSEQFEGVSNITLLSIFDEFSDKVVGYNMTISITVPQNVVVNEGGTPC